MSKMFKIVGVIVIILALISFLQFARINILLGAFSAFLTAVLGTAFIAIGELLDRVEYLEEQLNISLEGATSKDESLPQKTCPKCLTKHDFDYPKCPNCKFEH